MKNNAIARRYARALFELAVLEKSVDETGRALLNLAHAFETMPAFERALRNPQLDTPEKEGLVKTVSSNPHVLKLMGLLVKRSRSFLVPGIAAEFERLADAAQGLHRVTVRTASVLTEAEKKKIEAGLAASLGGFVTGHFDVAKELIGGVWIKMGDRVLDLSLKGRFDDIRHALLLSTN